ncbi:MAG: alpha/beta fold hydrolase, partial [Gammaproteobacteria bacterium]
VRLLDSLFDQMFTSASDTAVRQHIIDRARRMPEATGRALLTNMFAWDAQDLEAALDTIGVPLIAIQSTHVNEKRRRVPLNTGDSTPYLGLIKERVKDARIVIVPGAGHFTMIDAADRTNRLIESMTI